MSQGAATLQSEEIADLQKRIASLRENLNKAEVSSYHVSEELRESRITTERLRQEEATLRAENTFLKVSLLCASHLGRALP